jgi:parallel beta-helix repeat protein
MRRSDKINFGLLAALLLASVIAPILVSGNPITGVPGTFYIKQDGSVEPASAPIHLVNGAYTFTANIQGSLIIERNNTIIDGAGFGIFGTGANDSRQELTPYNPANQTKFPPIFIPSEPDNPYIAPESNNTGIYSYAQNLTISNLTISHCWCAIELEYSSNNQILGNYIVNNRQGIWIHTSSNNIISSNKIDLNKQGITLQAAHSSIGENNFTSNSEYAIKLQWSFNELFENKFFGNGCGVSFEQSSHNTLRNNNFESHNGETLHNSWTTLPDYVQDIDTSNTVCGKPMYYWINRQNATVPADAGYVALVNCTGIRVSGLVLGEGQEIRLSLTTNSTVTLNTLSNKNACIYVERSSKNNLTENTVEGGGNACCIQLKDSDDNYLFQNNLTEGNQGICLDSSNRNTVINNQIMNCFQGIRLYIASGNLILENNVTSNQQGLFLFATVNWEDAQVENETVNYPNIHGSTRNNISKNIIEYNNVGVLISLSSNNSFTSNNFLNNTSQVAFENPLADYPMNDDAFSDVINSALINSWDNDTTGNFWSDYISLYPNAQEQNATGTWDLSYRINENNVDRHPLSRQADVKLPENGSSSGPSIWPIAGAICALLIILALIVYLAATKKNKRKSLRNVAVSVC